MTTDPPMYLITLPDTIELINMNTTKGGRWVKAKRAAVIRAAARKAATGMRTMTRARVICYVTRPSLGDKWDPGNWYASAKPGMDGIVDAKVLPDDSIAHVIGPDMRGRRGVKHPPNGLLEFVIIDLSEVSRGEQDDRSPDL